MKTKIYIINAKELGILTILGLVSACGGGTDDKEGGGPPTLVAYTVSATAGLNGSISPASASVAAGSTTNFILTPDSGYQVDSVTGCNGSLSGNTYATGAVNADCTVTAAFIQQAVGTVYTVTANAGANGRIDPTSTMVNEGDTAVFVVTADSGYQIDNVSGCNGNLNGNNYTTGAVTAECTVEASFVITPTSGALFTKLDNAGNPLSDQSADYATTRWACVRDNLTRQVWEVKTDAGLQSANRRYYWQDFPAQSDRCADNNDCTVEGFTTALNATGLCGNSDWRLPNRGELLSIVDYGSSGTPLIDPSYFPNTAGTGYWSAEKNAYQGGFGARRVVDFLNGSSRTDSGSDYHAVRMIRGGQ